MQKMVSFDERPILYFQVEHTGGVIRSLLEETWLPSISHFASHNDGTMKIILLYASSNPSMGIMHLGHPRSREGLIHFLAARDLSLISWQHRIVSIYDARIIAQEILDTGYSIADLTYAGKVALFRTHNEPMLSGAVLKPTNEPMLGSNNGRGA